jgi:hypothetical protein
LTQLASHTVLGAPVTIRLEGAPNGTQFFLNGQPVAGTTLRLAGSATEGRLRVECKGYRPRIVTFTPSRDQTIDVSLSKQ